MVSSMAKKSNKKAITFYFKEDDVCNLFAYQTFLQKHIGQGNKIPARVLKKFFSYFEPEHEKIKKEIEERTGEIKQSTINKFCNDSEYNFSVQLPMNVLFNSNNVTKECCIKDLIESAFVYVESNIIKVTEKNEFISIIYKSINDYFNYFTGDTEKIFSTYKRTVLTGYVVHKLGFHLSKEIVQLEGKEPPNQLLYQSVKYYIDKLKKERQVN